MKIPVSVQLQTVPSMSDQEIDRDRAMPSYQRLKIMARRRIDQMTRTRKFRARNVRTETGVSVKFHKGKNVSVERRSQWKAHGQCSRGDSRSFIHGGNRGRQAQSSSLAPKVQTQIDGRKPSKGVRMRAKVTAEEIAQIRRVSIGNSPVCQNFKYESGCKFGDKCLFRHTEADGQPSEKSKKCCGKGSVASPKESKQLGCVSQDAEPPKKSSLRKRGKLGSNFTVTFCQGTWHHLKKSGKKGSIARSYSKVSTSRTQSVCAKFEDRTLQEDLHQERCARREAWDLAKHVHKLKTKDKATFHSPTEAWALPAPSSKKARGARIRGRFWSISAHADQKKDSSSAELEIQELHNGDYSQWKCKQVRKHRYTFTILSSS